MIEATGNLWTYPADFRVITTNGSVRRDGSAVLGRGCAKEAATRYPQLPLLLGTTLMVYGNHVHFFSREALGPPAHEGVFTFPVKHRWMEDADPALILRSVGEFARHLLASATYVLPRPGCGNGRLQWADVRPLVVSLPDNVVVITYARR